MANDKNSRAHNPALAFVGQLALGLSLTSCTVTSPHWDYVPDSTTSAIPFQAFTTYTANPVVIECAKDTSAHGSPLNGEASYIVVTSLSVATSPLLDAQGASVYSASGNVTLPSQCWDYFGDYDFWQANIRVSQVMPDPVSGGTTKRIFSSHDLAGLECLGRENGKAASWFGFLGKGCEKTYLGSSTVIPYIVLRIEGYAEGLSAAASARSLAASPSSKARLPAPARDTLIQGAPAVQAFTPVSPELAAELKSRLK